MTRIDDTLLQPAINDEALHRLDFNAAFRASVVRDVVMPTLLIGTSAVCGIGVYLGFRRLFRPSGGFG